MFKATKLNPGANRYLADSIKGVVDRIQKEEWNREIPLWMIVEEVPDGKYLGEKLVAIYRDSVLFSRQEDAKE